MAKSSERLLIVLTIEQKEKLRYLAKKANLSMASYVKNKILSE